jgi:hypothetical protein
MTYFRNTSAKFSAAFPQKLPRRTIFFNSCYGHIAVVQIRSNPDLFGLIRLRILSLGLYNEKNILTRLHLRKCTKRYKVIKMDTRTHTRAETKTPFPIFMKSENSLTFCKILFRESFHEHFCFHKNFRFYESFRENVRFRDNFHFWESFAKIFCSRDGFREEFLFS